MGKFETVYKSEITCPFCGEEIANSYKYDDDGEIECCDCGKKYEFTRVVNITYDTNGDCRLNNEEHDYGPYRDLNFCKKCAAYNLDK